MMVSSKIHDDRTHTRNRTRKQNAQSGEDLDMENPRNYGHHNNRQSHYWKLDNRLRHSQYRGSHQDVPVLLS